MGKSTNGFFNSYLNIGTYPKLLILLLGLVGYLGIFTGVSAAQACVTSFKAAQTGACFSTTQSPPSAACTTAGCPVATTFGCAPSATPGTTNIQCVSQTNAVQFPICSIYNTVHSIIFLLGLVLIILGGALYAGSHVMPGQTKGTVQGYGMGFILGGVIGVIIAIIAPFIIGVISGQTASVISSVCLT